MSVKVYKEEEEKAEVFPIIMSSDDSNIEEIEINNHLRVLEQPFAPSSTSATLYKHQPSQWHYDTMVYYHIRPHCLLV